VNVGILLRPAIQNSSLATLEAGCGCFEPHDVEGQRRFAATGDGVVAGESADILSEGPSPMAQVKNRDAEEGKAIYTPRPT